MHIWNHKQEHLPLFRWLGFGRDPAASAGIATPLLAGHPGGHRSEAKRSHHAAMALLAALAMAASTAALGPADAMVVLYSYVSSSMSKYAVVLLDTLPSGETISVTDDGWVAATCAARHAATPLTAHWPTHALVCRCPEAHSATWLTTRTTNRT